MSLSRLCCATGAGIAIIVAGGCRDAAAEQRQEVQAAIVKASQTIGQVRPVRAGADDAASVRQELTRAVAELNVASSGEPGQKAAAEERQEWTMVDRALRKAWRLADTPA